ncbi:hypothetical protein HPB51_022161 [Rhipicephalus microplus]|uniref:Transposable element P transposase n=1 Tax=Rhipicephalus microplus TaxID=6941 RepID=A0A9J6E4T3_RHIMP|nr:hypothetical protein HPB51_022161 [Rhipicephalus microplus]
MLPVLTVKQQAATYTNGLYVFSAKCSGKVLSNGLKVDFIKSDGASWNRRMWTLMGVKAFLNEIKCSAPHPVDEHCQLYFISDFPHLLKCLRNRLVCLDFQTPKGQVKRKRPYPKSRDFLAPPGPERSKLCDLLGAEDFPEYSPTNSSTMSREAHNVGLHSRIGVIAAFRRAALGNKLMKVHVQCEKQKMKVRYAAQALSSSVSDAFDFCENVLKGKLKYLLTHKLSQDHAENFFGSVRGRGGYNNNPTAAQFMAAYKRLLVQAEVTSSSSGNCTKDMVFILNATTVLAQVDAASTLTYMHRSSILEPHDDHYTPPENLSAVVVAVVPYIAGFVVHQVCKTRTCEECIAALYSDEPVPLVEQKNRGGLVSPSKDVIGLRVAVKKGLRRLQIVC